MLQPGDNLPDGSLERVEVIMALEKAFGIAIPDEDAKRLRTMQDAIDYMRRKKGGDVN